MSCPPLTNKGGKLSISRFPVPCELTLPELAQLDYVVVPGVGSIGDTGIEQEISSYSTTNAGVSPQSKGAAVGKAWDVEMLESQSEARDILEAASAVGNHDTYATRIEWRGGDVEYSIVQVSSPTYVKGAPSGVRIVRYTMVPSIVPIVKNPLQAPVLYAPMYDAPDTVVLNWFDLSSIEDGVHVYASYSKIDASALPPPTATLAPNTVQYDYAFDMGEVLEERLYFRVAAFNSDAVKVSNEVSIGNPANVLYSGSPTWLFGDGESGFANTLGIDTLYTDTAGTTPVEAYGDTIALATNLADDGPDMVQATGAERPVYGRMPVNWFGGSDDAAGLLNGDSGTNFTTPHSAALGITGAIDVRARAVLPSLTPAVNQFFVSKMGISGNFSWNFGLLTGGTLRFLYSPNGSNSRNVASTVTVADAGVPVGQPVWLRVAADAPNGTVDFYWSSDGSTWTPIGTQVTFSANNMFNSSAALAVGSGSESPSNPSSGRIYRAIVKDGIDGTTVADFNPSDSGGGFNKWNSSTTGEQWTPNGDAFVASGDAVFNELWDQTIPGTSSTPIAYLDTSDDNFSWTLSAGTYHLFIAGDAGCYFDTVAHAGGAFTVGPTTWTGGPAGATTTLIGQRHVIMPVILGREFTQFEREQLVAYARVRGCPTLYTKSANLWTGENLAVGAGWTDNGDGTYTSVNQGTGPSAISQPIAEEEIPADALYIIDYTISRTVGSHRAEIVRPSIRAETPDSISSGRMYQVRAMTSSHSITPNRLMIRNASGTLDGTVSNVGFYRIDAVPLN